MVSSAHVAEMELPLIVALIADPWIHCASSVSIEENIEEEYLGVLGTYINIHLVREGLRKRALCSLWELTPEVIKALEEDEVLEPHFFTKVLSDGSEVGHVFICRKGDLPIADHRRDWTFGSPEDSTFIGHALGYCASYVPKVVP